jgi:Acetyltransferase (GNAT) domain
VLTKRAFVVAENPVVTPDISPVQSTVEPQAGHRAAAVETQPVNPVHDPDWDDRVMAHRDYSFFHSAAWAKTLQAAYGFSPCYFTSDKNGELSSILPLMEVNSWLTGRRGVALPFTDFCGPLGTDIATARRLVQNALELGKSRGWKSVEFRGAREYFGGAPASLAFYGHSLELDMDEDRMFARLDNSVRRAIRKAAKSGVTVSVSRELDAVKTFFTLQCRTRKKHGLPPQPFGFFRNIFKHVLSKNLGIVVIASHGNRPIAASVYFQLGGRAIYKYGASDESFQQLRGVNIVMWEAMKRLTRDGAKTMHLGRTSISNEGLRRFKLGWGAEEHKIEYVKYDTRRKAFVTGSDETVGLHNRLFRAMPICLSRMVGAALYRHWA